ncbi:PA2778 family cysteine peptidase [Paraglaciecola aestuariivivens]
MSWYNKWCGLVLLASLLLLQACQSLPQSQQLKQSPLTELSTTKTIQDVPFYPQQAFYCGPTTLSEVLNFNGFDTAPEQIAPQLFIPGREGSLQLEMVSAARTFGMLAYAKPSSLTELFYLVEHNVPVIVFQNLGTTWIPMWHYAVVIGFDQQQQQVILHTGVTRQHSMSYDLFERVWQRAGYWSLALLPPEQDYEFLEPFTYIGAAYDLLSLGYEKQGLAHLENATKLWPNQWLSYFLLGNYYLDKSSEAITWFERGFKLAKNNTEYLNNYSYALANQGCLIEANQLITQALNLAPDNNNLQDSAKDIRQMQNNEQTPRSAHCPSIVF